MKIKNYKYAVLLLLLGSTSAAYATGEGFYVGAQVGRTNTNNQQMVVNDGSGIPNPGQPPINGVSPDGNVHSVSSNPSNTGVGGRLYFGYSANQYAGFELGWTHYAPSNYSSAGLTNPGCGKPSISESAYDLVAKGTYPFVSGFGVFGKAGIAWATRNVSGSLNSSVGGTCGSSAQSSSLRPVIGIGASYDMTQNWVADLSWTRMLSGSGFKNADLYALGVSYHWVDKSCGQFLC